LYRIDDLQVSPESGAGAFLCTFDLAKLDPESGKNQNSSNRTQLAIKAEGKEIALLSGFLGRHCSFGELRYTRLIKQSELVEEIRSLRAENHQLRQEVENLYGALDSLQRPKMIS
jgi:cell division protein FtsB